MPSPSSPVGHLLDDPQTQRLEDRHERRQIDLAAGLVELHAREPLAGGLVPQPDDEPLVVLLQLVELEDVVDDQVPVAVRLVVVGEPGAYRSGKRRAAISAPTRAISASRRSSSQVRASRSTSCSSSS